MNICIYIYFLFFFQALEVAGQVAGSSVSTSPLPYNAMASQCEALGTGTRKKLSNWLAHDTHHGETSEKFVLTFPANGRTALSQVRDYCTCANGFWFMASLNYQYTLL